MIDEPDAGDGEGGARVDRDDPRPGAVEGHELDVERVLEPDVGDVRLAAGDPVEPADAGRRAADAPASLIGHRSGSVGGRAATASMICS